MEYWTMVDWVKPALLGTKQEFTNMFSNPITNGQAKVSCKFSLETGFSDLSDTLKFQIAIIYERNYESIPIFDSRFL